MSMIKKGCELALVGAVGAAAGIVYEGIKQEKRLDIMEEQNKKMKCFFNLLIQWIILKQDGINLKEYFEFNNYHTIAVYGMAELGQRLVEELQETGIEVRYIVDKNADRVVAELPKYKPDEQLPDVDVMVVTAVYYYQDIEEEMSQKVQFPIISLEDVVYGLA